MRRQRMPGTCFARAAKRAGQLRGGADAESRSRRLRFPEEGELHAPVAPLLPEFRICGEVHLLRMFENQHAFGTQQVVFEHQPYDLLAALQIVGGVRENHVELFRTAFEVEEDVGFDRIEVPDAQLRRRLADEVVVYRIDFHRGYAPRSARCKLIADRAGSREEVQHVALLEIQQIAEDVEEVLLGEIGRRPRPQVAGRVDGPALVFSAYYSHTICLKYPPSFRFNARPSPLPMRSV